MVNSNGTAVGSGQPGSWKVPTRGDATFQWDYDSHDEQVLRLYAQGKERQWNAAGELDWEHELDPDNPLGIPDEFVPIAGTRLWERLPETERVAVRRHTQAWAYSQTLHGEQFALVGLGRLCSAMDDVDAKLFAATQMMDEARHVEGFNRLVTDKIGIRYPLCGPLRAMFEDALHHPDPDFFGIAGMVLENLALVMLTTHRSRLTDPLGRAFTEYVARDEARHIAFGRIYLRRRFSGLSTPELRQREEFALDCCRVLHQDFAADAVWHTLGFGREVAEAARTSVPEILHRRKVFRHVVPSLQDIGLFGPRMREGLEAMGLLRFARRPRFTDPGGPGQEGSPAADAIAHAETAARRQDIEAVARLGATAGDTA
ncbi:diiron oxygenase [Streptomyces netropsis]|uniref:diiron oxygenase n=1 Tax=Streptomyces netropsis TaxID=55404 RepID=UPI0037B857BC